jgi:hypothetical protein
MDEISGDYNRFFRGDAGNESTFQYAGFIPRDRLYRCICDTGTLLGKRELLQNGEHMRKHRRTREIRKPQT